MIADSISTQWWLGAQCASNRSSWNACSHMSRITNTVELLYLTCMLRWERSAPLDGHEGLLDDRLEKNTQITRLAYVLKLVGAGVADRVFAKLERFTRRDDGHSYVSKDATWMIQPHPLTKGWTFEGCTSLVQKQEILRRLTEVGVSAAFVACAADFVAGNSVEKYLPTDVEQEEMLREIGKQEQGDAG